MRLTTSTHLVAAVVAACALLTACGGGGGDSAPAAAPAPAADKYVGTWKTTCIAGAGGYFRTVLTINKRAENAYTGKFSIDGYTAAGCTGTATPVPGDVASDNFKVVGTKMASGKTVDKITNDTGGDKDLAYSDNTILQFGEDIPAKDAEGFPLALNTSLTLTKS